MYLSRVPPNKRAPKVWGLIDKLPEELREVLKNSKIIYRGVVDLEGKFGDVLIRDPDNHLLNVIWDEDYGEIRQLDRSFLRKLISTYDATIQQYKIRNPEGSLDDLFILNEKLVFKTRKLRKTKGSGGAFEPL